MKFKVINFGLPWEDDDGVWQEQNALKITLDNGWSAIAVIENDMDQLAMALQDALNSLAEKLD